MSEKGVFYKVHVMDDKARTQDSVKKPVKVEMGNYKVLSEHGLFKNGKQYEQGDKIELVKATAENFLKAGEIKEIKK